MKKQELIQLIENTTKKVLSETLKSSIAKSILTSPLVSKSTKLNQLDQLKWDELEDKDIIKITPDEARRKIHYEDLIMWFDSSDKLLAISRWNTIRLTDRYYGHGRYGRGKSDAQFTSTVQLKEASAYCYIIPYDVLKRLSISSKRIERNISHDNALAFTPYDRIKDANITRYKNIIAQRHSANADIDNKVKEIMKSYYMSFENIIPTEDKWDKRSAIEKLNLKINNLLTMYKEYVYIKPDLDKFSAYNHQTKEMEDIIKKINDLFLILKKAE